MRYRRPLIGRAAFPALGVAKGGNGKGGNGGGKGGGGNGGGNGGGGGGSGGPPLSPFTAIVKMAADLTAFDATSGVTMAYDAEVIDNVGFHSNVTNNQRITIPAEHTGKYALVTACVNTSSATGGFMTVTLKHYNISNVLQREIENKGEQGTGSAGLQTATFGPVLLTTGDYFTVDFKYTSDSSITVSAENSRFSLLILDDYIDGAVFLKNAADLTGQDLSAAPAITFDTEVFDTDGFHSTASNTELITIPSTGYAIAFGQFSMSAGGAGDLVSAQITHRDTSDVSIRGYLTRTNSTGETTRHANVCSGLMAVTAGDDILLHVGVTGDTSITIDADKTYLGLVSFPASGLIGAQAVNSVDKTLVDMTGVDYTFTFDSDYFDTSNIHDTSVNTERLTAPASVRYALVNATCRTSLTTSDTFLRLWIRHYDSGGVLKREYGHATRLATTIRNNNVTAFTEVDPGDYFVMMGLGSTDTSVSILAITTSFSAWFIP